MSLRRWWGGVLPARCKLNRQRGVTRVWNGILLIFCLASGIINPYLSCRAKVCAAVSRSRGYRYF